MKRLEIPRADLTDRNIDRIGDLFPSVITEIADGKGSVRKAIDFDRLRQELSDVVVDGPQERYQLDWPGKRAALLAANSPVAMTLRPSRDESLDFDTAKNLFIEGDNLVALKLLQESYLARVKLIYIDPPYNTGSDFVYNDNFSETSLSYLRRSDQLDSDGAGLVSNTETNGRFHSTWLSMMYPRLRLARNLLRNDGLIMISIDENEIGNLIALCDEVFGSSNRMGMFVWERKKKPSFLRKTMGVVTEYIVAYARDYAEVGPLVAGAGEEGKKYPINNAGNAFSRLVFPSGSVRFGIPDGDIAPQDMSEGNIRTVLVDQLTIRDGVNATQLVLDGEWRYSQRKIDEIIEAGGEIRISKMPFRPNYVNQEDRAKKTANLLSHRVNKIPTNEDATAEIREIFGSDVMDFPKPVGLLKYLISTCVGQDELVLDFFAGSATTAHAVAAVNADDGGDRQFIMVQLDERVPEGSAAHKAGLLTVSAIGRERIRRIDADPTLSRSLAFRSLRVDTTNMTDTLKTPNEAEQQLLDLQVESVKQGRTGEDLLFQVLLEWGLELSLPIVVEQIEGCEVLIVDGGALIACFARQVNLEVVLQVAKLQPLRAVFLDACFDSDDLRINTEQIFREISPSTEVRTI